MENGADVNARTKAGRTAPHFAVFYMHDRGLVQLLIGHGADVNARDEKGRTPLVFAVAKGSQDLADLLRQYGGVD